EGAALEFEEVERAVVLGSRVIPEHDAAVEGELCVDEGVGGEVEEAGLAEVGVEEGLGGLGVEGEAAARESPPEALQLLGHVGQIAQRLPGAPSRGRGGRQAVGAEVAAAEGEEVE